MLQPLASSSCVQYRFYLFDLVALVKSTVSMRLSFLPAKGSTLAWMVVWAFVPMAILSLMAMFYGKTLSQVVPMPLSNMHALKHLLVGFSSLDSIAKSMYDSWLPMHAALETLHGSNRDFLYETLFFGQSVRFQYPPSSLLLMDLLERMGHGSYLVMNLINMLSFVGNGLAIAYLALQVFGPVQSDHQRILRNGTIVLAFIAALVFYPLVRAVNLGQIQIWIDLMFTLACIAWVANRRMLAGICIGVACSLKPQFGILLLASVLWREWLFVRGMLIVVVPITLVSLTLYGLHNHFAYLDVLSYLSRHGESFFANNSVNGILNRLIGNGSNILWTDKVLTPFHPAVYVATLATTVIVLGYVAISSYLRRGRASVFDLCAASLCTVLASPVSWEHHYGIALPVFIILAVTYLKTQELGGRTAKLILLGISWFLIANFIGFANLLAGSWLNLLQGYVFFGAVILLILIRLTQNAVEQADLPAQFGPGGLNHS